MCIRDRCMVAQGRAQTLNSEAANNRYFKFSVPVISVPQKYRSEIPVTGISAHSNCNANHFVGTVQQGG